MKRSTVTAFALGFGLLSSIAGAGLANAMPNVPDGAAAAAQKSGVTQVWYRGGHHGWRRGRPGYRWRPGYGWVPFAIAGAVVAGVAGAAAGAYYDGPGPYYYDAPPPPPPPAYYGPDDDYGPGPGYEPIK